MTCHAFVLFRGLFLGAAWEDGEVISVQTSHLQHLMSTHALYLSSVYLSSDLLSSLMRD